MEFQPDYVISWDFTDHDNPTVTVSRIRAEAKTAALMIDNMDIFHSSAGVCSLRQVIEEFERTQREEKEKK